MGDPYLTLGIQEMVSNEDVVNAYHKKLREFPPEEFPEQFAFISEAYEAIRTESDRVDLRLFGPVPSAERISELAEHEQPEPPRTDRDSWQAIATKSWLSGRLSR